MKMLTSDNRMMCGDTLYTVTATGYADFARVTVTKGFEKLFDRNRAGRFDQSELDNLTLIALMDGMTVDGLSSPAP